MKKLLPVLMLVVCIFAFSACFVPGAEEPTDYTVTFEANGGTAVAAQTVEANGKINATEVSTAKEGCILEGWYVSSVFEGEAWSFEEDTVASDITLYAKWKTCDYVVSFNANGGTAVTAQALEHNGKIDAAKISSAKAGYELEGWYTAETLEGAAWDFDNDVVTSDITLYAKWTLVEYTITFDENINAAIGDTALTGGAKITCEDEITLTVNEVAGFTYGPIQVAGVDSLYTFENGVLSNVFENITVSCTKTTKSFVITYMNVDFLTNENPDSYDVEDEDITLQSVEKVGYVFGGWYTDEALTTALTVIDTATASDITLYAKFTKEAYNILFDADGGTVTPASATVSYGDAVSTEGLPVPTKQGYEFAGWFIKENDALTSQLGVDITAVPDLGANGTELTVYAKWTRPIYSITLEGGEGTDGAAKVELMTSSINVETEAGKLAYTVEGYYTDATLATKVANADGSLIASVEGYTDAEAKWIKEEACTLYVKWEVASYSLTSGSNLYAYVGGDYQGMKQTVTDDADGYTSSFTITTGGSIYDASGTLTLTVDMTDDEKAALKAAGYNYLMFTMKQTTNVKMTFYTTADGTRAYNADGKTGTFDFVMSFLYGGERVFYFPIDSTTVKLRFDRYTGLAASTTYEYMLKDVVPCTDAEFLAGIRLDANPAGAEIGKTSAFSATTNVDWQDRNVDVKYDFTLLTDGAANQALKINLAPNCSATMLTALQNAGYTGITFDYYTDYVFTSDGNSVLTSYMDRTSGAWTTVTVAFDTLKTYIDGTRWNALPGWITLYSYVTESKSFAIDNAQFYIAPKYTVNFDVNGGTAIETTQVTVQLGDAITESALPVTTRDGYEFAGWYTKDADGNFDQRLGTDITAMPNIGDDGASVTVYAKWITTTYTVTLEGGDGTDGSASVASTDNAISISTAPSQTAFELVGYYTDDTLATMVANADGSLIADIDGYTDENGSWIQEGDCTLYAGWTVKTYGFDTSNSVFYAWDSAGEVQTNAQAVSDDADGYVVKYNATPKGSAQGSSGQMKIVLNITDAEKTALKAAGYTYLKVTMKQTAGGDMKLYNAVGDGVIFENSTLTGSYDFILSFGGSTEAKEFYWDIDNLVGGSSNMIRLCFDYATGLRAVEYEYMLMEVVPCTAEELIAGIRLDSSPYMSGTTSYTVEGNTEYQGENVDTLYAFTSADGGYEASATLNVRFIPNVSATILSSLKELGYTSVTFDYYLDFNFSYYGTARENPYEGYYYKTWATKTFTIDELITMCNSYTTVTIAPWGALILGGGGNVADGSYAIANVQLVKAETETTTDSES